MTTNELLAFGGVTLVVGIGMVIAWIASRVPPEKPKDQK